ncbi:MAG: heme NO-binding domain-containing protein [Alphaproteobacteria bacterium]
MKGVVFTEFLEMVEDYFSPDVADSIIEASDLPSGGAYTAVGTYDHAEIVTLVQNLSAETGLGLDLLLRSFGKHLFARFVQGYPAFFEGKRDAFHFLQSVEDHIHVEVRKLYPDAELPSVAASLEGPNHLKIVYRSDRNMGDLAHGLIEGCVQHFAEPIEIQRSHVAVEAGDRLEFDLLRAA